MQNHDYGYFAGSAGQKGNKGDNGGFSRFPTVANGVVQIK
jgi:hypothetical protein